MNWRFHIGAALAIASYWVLPCDAVENNQYDKVVGCSYGYKNPMTSGEAKISFKDGMVQRILFHSYYPGERGKLSFTCHVDLDRRDDRYLWLDYETGLTIVDRENGDSFKLTRKRKNYKLNFENLKALSKYCGAGAEVPLEVSIPFSGKTCKARLPE